MKATMLADIYRSGIKSLTDATENDIERGKSFLASLDGSVPIVADNVSAFLGTKDHFDPERDLPTLAPPFEKFWVEYDHPEQIGEPDRMRVGALFQAYEFEDHDAASAIVDGYFRGLLERSYELADGDWKPTIDPVRWVLGADVCLKWPGIPAIGPIKSWYGAICPDGSVARTECGHRANTSAYYGSRELLTPDYVRMAARCLTAGFLAISFMHCRNVVQTDHLPSRQQRREMQRRGEPVLTYKTLSIEPMRKVLATEGGIERNGIKKALHICRGHFSTYSEEKPLFGKYSGSFWVPAHVRGSAEAGKVVKDYAVKAPKEAV